MSGEAAETTEAPLIRDGHLEGLRTALMVLEWPSWRERRIVTFELCDVWTARRHTQIEYSIPDWFLDRLPDENRLVLPISFLKKQTYFNFEVSDENARVVSPLGSRHASRLSSDLLKSAGRAATGADLPDAIVLEVQDLVGRDIDRARVAAERIRTWIKNEAGGDLDTGRQTLVRLVELLSANYLLMVEVDPTLQFGHVIRYSYDVEAERDGDWRTRARRSIGLLPINVSATMTHADRVGSLHLEIPAPAETHVTNARLEPTVETGDSMFSAAKARFYLAGDEAPPAGVNAVAELRPRPSLITRASVFTSIVTAAFLAFGAWRVPELQRDADAAVAILSVLSGLVSIIAAGAGESRFTSANVLGLRILAVTPGFLSIASAAFLIAGFGVGWTRSVWILSAAISIVCSGLLIRVWSLSRQEPAS